MSSRFIMPFADVGSGINISSGAQLFFFELDGVTPKDTFSDQLSTPTPNANPVISDSNGVFGDIYIVNQYKVTLKDKNDSQIFGLALVDALSGSDGVLAFDSVADLAGLVGSVADQQISVNEYNAASNVGNFSAAWRDDLAGTVHNGVRYHSPRRSLASEGLAAYVSTTPVTDAVLGVWENKEQILTVEMAGAGVGAADDTSSFNAAFAAGPPVEATLGTTYTVGDVDLPTRPGWSFDAKWATYAPLAGAATCFIGNFDDDVYNYKLNNFVLDGNIADFIIINTNLNGVIADFEIRGIKCLNGTGNSIVTMNNDSPGQGENIRVKDITLNFNNSFNYCLYIDGGTVGYGSMEVSHIFHNGNAAIAAVYANVSVLTSKFELIYATRGTALFSNTGADYVNCSFVRCEVEPVQSNTVIYVGSFINCDFVQSWIYNSFHATVLDAAIAIGVFQSCSFERNFVFIDATGIGTDDMFSLSSGSKSNVIHDLYDAVTDNPRFPSAIENLGDATLTVFPDYGLTGLESGTGINNVRKSYAQFSNGTVAATINAQTVSKWNGNTNSPVDDIGLAATVGIWTLSAAGDVVTLDSTGLSGGAITVLATNISLNFTGQHLTVDSFDSTGDIVFSLKDAATGAAVNLATLVDTGALRIEIVYITAS